MLVTAKRAGDFTIQARSDNGSSGATITVMDGAALPQGTVKWSGAAIDGCKTTKVIPAVPSANGPDIYEQSQCQDGEYLAAYTSEGIQLWRRKIGDTGAPSVPEAGKNDVPAIRPNSSRLDLHSPSICDLADVGAGQEKIRELLNQHNLSFNQGAANERAWTIDESTVQCKLWFDEKLVLAKKRKILVTE
jgi:hypothetical protein